jgi:hypothetical protein
MIGNWQNSKQTMARIKYRAGSGVQAFNVFLIKRNDCAAKILEMAGSQAGENGVVFL